MEDRRGYRLRKILVNLETMPGIEQVLPTIEPQFGRKVYGCIYAVPWTVISQMMIYNKELFSEAGLDPEKPVVTFPLLKVYLETVVNGTMEPDEAVRLAAQWTREKLKEAK